MVTVPIVKLSISKFSEYVKIEGQKILCDGKICGKGKPIGGSYLCPHRNLRTKFPQLVNEEWDFKKNEKNPEEYLPTSHVVVWWKCKNNLCGCHQWQTRIATRTSKSSGCPFCDNKQVCKHNNLSVRRSELLLEFHGKNIRKPEEFSYGSKEIVWWKCKNDPCGCHEWEATINSRTKIIPTGCPFCANKQVCKHNNLAVLYPDIIKEYDLRKNTKPPEEFSPYSNILVWWKCKDDPCGCHKWETCISDRTFRASGCPFCKNKKVCPHNNFAIKFPNLVLEFDQERNPDKPEEYSYGSRKKVHWKCKENSEHRWRTSIGSRTNIKEPTGCPFCFFSRRQSGYSKKSIEWLKTVEKQENIQLQYLDPEKGISEYFILDIGKVDGYCKETNTVYEFHGDFWHGNPNKFDSEDINPFNCKTFRQLYQETLKRDQKIKKLGYNLVVKWETDLEEYNDINIDNNLDLQVV